MDLMTMELGSAYRVRNQKARWTRGKNERWIECRRKMSPTI